MRKPFTILIAMTAFFSVVLSQAGMIKFDLKGVLGIGDLQGWRHMEHSKDFEGCAPCHLGKIGERGNLFSTMTEAKNYKGCTTGTCHLQDKGHDAVELKELAKNAGILKTNSDNVEANKPLKKSAQ